MDALRLHGLVGGKNVKSFETVSAIDSLQFPVLKTLNISVNSRVVLTESRNGKYIFYSYSTYINVYDAITFEFIVQLNSPLDNYHELVYAFELDGRVFLSGLNRNLNDSYQSVYVYDETDWSYITHFLGAPIVKYLSHDENYIYCLTQLPAETTGRFTVFDRVDLSYTKPNIAWSSEEFIQLHPTDLYLVQDRYTYSNRVIMDALGNIVVPQGSVDSFLDDDFSYLIRNDKEGIVYGFKFNYSGGWYSVSVYYFDISSGNPTFIKQETLTDGYKLTSRYSYGLIHNKEKALTMTYSEGSMNVALKSFDIDGNGFFTGGSTSYQKYVDSGGFSPIYSFYDGTGHILYGINDDANRIQARKTYVTLS